jgi:hypothetical protein
VLNVWVALFAVALFGSARSCAVQDYVTWQDNGVEVGARSQWGTIYVQWQRLPAVTKPGWTVRKVSAQRCAPPVTPQEQQFNLLGFGLYKAGTNSLWTGFNFVTIPWWFLIVAPLAVPAVRVGRYVRDIRRTFGGRCGECGYDLRSTRENCPECGRPVKFYLSP